MKFTKAEITEFVTWIGFLNPEFIASLSDIPHQLFANRLSAVGRLLAKDVPGLSNDLFLNMLNIIPPNLVIAVASKSNYDKIKLLSSINFSYSNPQDKIVFSMVPEELDSPQKIGQERIGLNPVIIPVPIRAKRNLTEAATPDFGPLMVPVPNVMRLPIILDLRSKPGTEVTTSSRFFAQTGSSVDTQSQPITKKRLEI